MTQDEIIRMAREAGLEQVVAIDPKSGIQTVKCPPLELLERFAALVAANEREVQTEKLQNACKVLMADKEAAVLAERERCAKHAEDFMTRYEGAPMGIGEEIRSMK